MVKPKSFKPKRGGLNKTEKEEVRDTYKRLTAARVEKNYFLTNIVGQMPSLGAFNCVSLVPQATTASTDSVRAGDSIYLKSIHWSWGVLGYDATNRIRLTMFQWHGDNGANPPTNTDIWQAASATGEFGMFRKDTKNLYTILYDRTIPTNTYNLNKVGQVNLYKGFRRKINYLAGGTTGTGSIYTLITSDSGVAPHPSIDSQVSIRYTDS